MGSSSPDGSRSSYPTHARRNGWTCPLHPFQFITWFFTLYFMLIHFCCIAPSLIEEWRPFTYVTVAVSFVVYIAAHIVACTIDPADDNVRGQPKKEVPKLNRNEYPKVIENQHCYVCETEVGERSKHCSVCQKCVADFDHHCKWLNTCVGGRNYRYFIVTLVSSIVGVLIIFVHSVVLSVASWTDKGVGKIIQSYGENIGGGDYVRPATRQLLQTTEATREEVNGNPLYLFYVEIPQEAFVSVMIITAVLCLIAFGLVVHLFGFHVYLWTRGQSTYDYIIEQRDKEEERAREQEIDLEANSKAKKVNQIAPQTTIDDAGLPNIHFSMDLRMIGKENLHKTPQTMKIHRLRSPIVIGVAMMAPWVICMIPTYPRVRRPSLDSPRANLLVMKLKRLTKFSH